MGSRGIRTTPGGAMEAVGADGSWQPVPNAAADEIVRLRALVYAGGDRLAQESRVRTKEEVSKTLLRGLVSKGWGWHQLADRSGVDRDIVWRAAHEGAELTEREARQIGGVLEIDPLHLRRSPGS